MAAPLGSRVTQSTRMLGQKLAKSKDRLKGGKLEKIGSYFHRIFADYKLVAEEVVQGAKDKPGKAALYGAGFALLTVLAKTNPTETDYRSLLIESEQKLMLVGEAIRNPACDSYVQNLLKHRVADTLRYTNLGIFSIVWKSDFSPSCDLYVAQCKNMKPKWRDFQKQVLDIGICNRWIYFERAMVDYDVNPEEWKDTEDGEGTVAAH